MERKELTEEQNLFYDKGWEDAIKFKDRQLTMKLEGIEDVVRDWLKTSSGALALISAIRSHILGTGKKEE